MSYISHNHQEPKFPDPKEQAVNQSLMRWFFLLTPFLLIGILVGVWGVQTRLDLLNKSVQPTTPLLETRP